jgi:hypothetical protein
MRTLFAKILLWFWCTLAIFVVGSAFFSAFSFNQNASDRASPGARLVQFQLEEARVAYETGGRPALQAFLENLTRIYDAQGILTDEKGRDLLANRDRWTFCGARGASWRFRFSGWATVWWRAPPTMGATGFSSSSRARRRARGF